MTLTIAGEVRRYRQDRRLSAQQLADQCAKLGMDISRATIADLENGRRAAISVPELVVLARALDVPPMLLLAPVGHQETVEILPGRESTAYGAMEWFSGAAELVDDETDSGEPSLLAKQLPADANAAQLYREYVSQKREQLMAILYLQDALRIMKTGPPDQAVAHHDAERIMEMLKLREANIEFLRSRLTERGLILPPEATDVLITDDGHQHALAGVAAYIDAADKSSE